MSTTRAPCPQCDRGPRDTALSVTTDERGSVSYCHRCGYTSAHNTERLRLERIAPTLRPNISQAAAPLEWSERAEAIWRRTLPLRGTVGESYLLHRGCALPPPDSDLRFLEPTDRHPPTLCARVTNVITNAPQSLHFTRLASDGRGKAGTERDRLLLHGHRKKGGVIRLWPDEAVTAGIALAEGAESALAAAHLFQPVWSCIDCGNLGQFPLLEGIEALTVYADNDDAGLKAARACARRWRDAGRAVRVRYPANVGQDAADAAREVLCGR